MTLDDWVLEYYGYPEQKNAAQEACWDAAQQAEREKYAELITAAEAVVDDWYTKNFQIRTSTVEKLCELIERFKNEN